ncbi:MAG: nicotinate (nicotinamide) nucleotide adenylyltransferase [Chloroflexi bacterium]|nr:nicotinate (nicotinamide) nucleotide adenylyltransferase [Chloroflexota bacterium]
MKRIGLLGGTFDPPHIGHLWLAQTAFEQLQLDTVLFLPVGCPPHKLNQPVSAVSHRLAMVQLAIAANPAFQLDTTDLKRPPPHTTVTLLPHIHTAYPKTNLWLLAGSDSLHDLPAWEEPHRLITQCRLAILPRPGVTVNWTELETAVPNIKMTVDMLTGPTVTLSSTTVRQWAASGKSIQYLVNTAVWQYMQKHQLYAP